MTMLSEYDWESDTWTNNSDNPARAAFRAAVAEVALKAKATLPECNGRVDAAVKLVLNGDVELLEGGTAKVGSQSNGTTAYHIVNGSCDCKDYPKAPSNWCKHRIAAGVHKRATALANVTLDAPATDQAAPPSQPTPAPPSPATPATPLPEAPASVNVRLVIDGRDCQVTLRDTDETRLLTRLAAVLQQYPLAQACTPPPVTPAPASAPAMGEAGPTCPIHGTRLLQSKKGTGLFCPVKNPDGTYCRVRHAA
jgi:hypothetical protein